jgi:hypothetical protein
MRSHSKKNLANSAVSKSRKSVDAPKSAPVQQISASNSDSTSISQLKPAKTTRNRIPPPQRERIIQQYVTGKSIAQISREEHRNRETVARIVSGDEIKEFAQGIREEWYGLGPDALAAVRHGLQVEKNARLGYQFLKDMGIIPIPEVTEANGLLTMQPQPEELTSYERAIAQDESGRITPLGFVMARVQTQKAAMFNLTLPAADKLWRRRTVTALINEMTDGRGEHIRESNSVEFKTLEALAEDVLRGKRAMTDKDIVAVRKKY